MNAILISSIFCALLIINTLVKIWLDQRNKNYIKKNYDNVPRAFANSIALDEHQKAQRYSLTKIKASQLFDSIDLIIFIGWLLGGGLALADRFSTSLTDNPLLIGIIFFLIYSAVSFILALPQSIYSTFIIEEKFGFNKTSVKIFILDLIKGSILAIVIGLPILIVVLKLMLTLKTSWWIWAWIFLSTFQLFLLWLYPRVIAPLFNKFSPLEDGELKSKINQLLEKIGFSGSGLFIMDASKRSRHGNAYFTGFRNNKRIVLFDTLVKSLSPSQVEAVLAHELGHFKKNHITKKMIVSFASSFIGFAILGFLYNQPLFYQAHAGTIPSPHMALLLFSLVSPIYTFLFTPFFSYFSRKDEFEADRFAAEYSNSKELISALVQMYKDNASTLTPDPIYSAFYYSHPNAFDRIKFLETLS